MTDYQKAVSANPYRNKGGTVLRAGNITSNSPITQNFTLMETVTSPLTYGTKVSLSSGSAYSSGNVGTFNARTTFAYKQVAGRYIMPKMLSYVNGVALTAAQKPLAVGADYSGKPHRPIHFIESARSLGSGVSTSWNYETGAITKGAGAGESRSFNQDHAARPTNAVPGELTYKTGKLLPVQDDYKPKTSP